MLDIGSDHFRVGNPHKHKEPELHLLSHVYLWLSLEYFGRRSSTSGLPSSRYEPLRYRGNAASRGGLIERSRCAGRRRPRLISSRRRNEARSCQGRRELFVIPTILRAYDRSPGPHFTHRAHRSFVKSLVRQARATTSRLACLSNLLQGKHIRTAKERAGLTPRPPLRHASDAPFT